MDAKRLLGNAFFICFVSGPLVQSLLAQVVACSFQRKCVYVTSLLHLELLPWRAGNHTGHEDKSSYQNLTRLVPYFRMLRLAVFGFE
jgi:hypothetical protein